MWAVVDMGQCRPRRLVWDDLSRYSTGPGNRIDDQFTPGRREGGRRGYSARLWNIQPGESWEEACQAQPVTINGQRLARPDSRFHRGPLGIVGHWSVPDASSAVKIERPPGAVNWTAARRVCMRQGKQLCKRHDLCDGTRFLGSIPAGDVWLAVGDHQNTWISVGESYPERRCKLHERLGQAPAWGETTGPSAVTGNPTALVCCDGKPWAPAVRCGSARASRRRSVGRHGGARRGGRCRHDRRRCTMTTQATLRRFDEAIKLKRFDESATLREKRDRVLTRLRSGLKARFECFNQGSYAMGTGVKPIGARDYDIDVGVILPWRHDQISAQEAKAQVYAAVQGHTGQVEWRRSCVTVFYRARGEVAFHVDLAIYAQPGLWEHGLRLAVGKRHSGDAHSGWKPADPKGFIELMAQRQGEAGSQFRRVIRYLKRWKDVQFPVAGEAAPRGIALTACALQWFQPTPSWQTADDLSALLGLVQRMRGAVGFLGRLKLALPTAPGNDVFEKMTNDQMGVFLSKLARLEEALKAARSGSGSLWAMQQAFGGEFTA